MLRRLITAAAAVALLAGCSSGDDTSADSGSGDNGQASPSSPTPTTPELASFDPPKAFSPVAALAEPSTEDTTLFAAKSAIVGKTALYANRTGITGRWIDGGRSWQVLAKEIQTTKTTDFTAPMAVQLDGKEVIATAYVQTVEGGGTQKAHGQVNFQWIDPDEGKVLSTIAVDLTPAVGVGNGGERLLSHAYDAATGQVAVSVAVASPDRNAKIDSVTAYADPKTKKATLIPDLEAAGVLNGTVAGARGKEGEGSTALSIVVADGAGGTIKKNTPIRTMSYLSPESTGGQHAFFYGTGYVKTGEYDGQYTSSFYAVNLTTGALVETKLPNSEESSQGTSCFSDHVTGLVCNKNSGASVDEILAFDNKTGKKSWGYTSKSANRVVPKITAVYNGAVYGMAETLPAVLDLKTGQDLPVPTPTPGETPSNGSTPSYGSTPTDGSTPSDSMSPSTSSGNVGGWGDLSLLWGGPRSPESVSKYGSTYLTDPGDKAPTRTEKILVVQKAIG